MMASLTNSLFVAWVPQALQHPYFQVGIRSLTSIPAPEVLRERLLQQQQQQHQLAGQRVPGSKKAGFAGSADLQAELPVGDTIPAFRSQPVPMPKGSKAGAVGALGSLRAGAAAASAGQGDPLRRLAHLRQAVGSKQHLAPPGPRPLFARNGGRPPVPAAAEAGRQGSMAGAGGGSWSGKAVLGGQGPGLRPIVTGPGAAYLTSAFSSVCNARYRPGVIPATVVGGAGSAAVVGQQQHLWAGGMLDSSSASTSTPTKGMIARIQMQMQQPDALDSLFSNAGQQQEGQGRGYAAATATAALPGVGAFSAWGSVMSRFSMYQQQQQQQQRLEAQQHILPAVG